MSGRRTPPDAAFRQRLLELVVHAEAQADDAAALGQDSDQHMMVAGLATLLSLALNMAADRS
jgi:hypothetical protein